MSREIKFRVHCASTGKILAYEHFNSCLNWGYYWLDAEELKEKGDEAICHAPPEYFKHPNEMMSLNRVLFTGLQDRNGKDIYEGDLVITEQLEERDDCDSWHRDDHGIAVVSITPESGVVMMVDDDVWNWTDDEVVTHIRFIEVIGNIYDKGGR